MKVKDLDKALSVKLGDPVNNCEDGVIFKWENRLGYLQRAYSRLRRTLKWLMRSYAPKFARSQDYIIVDNIPSNGQEIRIKDSSGNEVLLTQVYELYALLEYAGNEYFTNCKYVNPENFLSIKHGRNLNYTPKVDDEQQIVYYTIFDNAFYLLPTSSDILYKKIEVVLEQDTIFFSEPDEFVNIPKDYIDILIELAANEGMQDLGRSDKFQLYTADINNQLASAKVYADILETKEGSNINDR